MQGRADVFALTQQTEDAALSPNQAGGISHAERAAIACRIARLNNSQALAEHYQQRLAQSHAADLYQLVADPDTAGMFDDQQLEARVRHVDLVTQTPKDAGHADIQALRDVGISDADIVRLAELIAFVNYQVRLLTGLRLLKTYV